MIKEDKENTKKRLLLFLALTFLVTYAFEFAVLFPKWREVRSIAALPIAAVISIRDLRGANADIT